MVFKDDITRLSDREIIQICQYRPEAFKELVQRYQEKITWAAYQMIGNFEEARDISQEAFIRAYRSLSQFNPESSFYTWLYRIGINLCIDFLRKQKHVGKQLPVEDAGEIPSSDISIGQYLEQKELSEEIQKVLNEIPHQYRAILILRDIEGFSCKEIEKIMDCNYNTVRWRLFRARQVFKEAWEKHQSCGNNKNGTSQNVR